MLPLLVTVVAIAVASTPPTVERPAPTKLLWPAQGTVTTPFVIGGHDGVDIGMLRSLTVRAAAPGVVTLVGEPRGYEGYGKVVVVDVGGGYTALYAHLARYGVRVGDEVRAGEPIARAGCTGWCTGTHLHFELRLRGRPVDPLRFRLGYNRPLQGG